MMWLQSDCDHKNPEERFLWAFQNLEFKGFPVGFPEEVLRQWSKHLCECGFVHDPSRQVIHFQPPVRGQGHPLNMSGEWVPVEQKIQEPVVSVLANLSGGELADLIGELRDGGLID